MSVIIREARSGTVLAQGEMGTRLSVTRETSTSSLRP